MFISVVKVHHVPRIRESRHSVVLRLMVGCIFLPAMDVYTLCRDGTRRFGLVEYYFVLPELVGTALVVVKQLEILPISRHTQFGVTDSAINHVANIIPIQESLRWDVTDLNKIESKCLFINFPSVCNNKIFPVEYMHD